MAEEPEREDEPLELTDIVEEPEAPEPERTDDDDPEPQVNDQDDGEETIVSFDGDDPDADQPDDNATLREIRQRNRELNQRIRELEKSSPKPRVERRAEPTMADHDFDEDAFKADFKAWQQEEEAAQAEEARANEANEAIQAEWTQDLQAFAAKRAALQFDDVDDAQATVEQSFDGVQQAVLVKAANDPALFMYALAKAPGKLAELAKIKDPVKLGAAIARMEGGIKVVKRRKGPAIDTPQRGSAAIAGTTADKKLEELERQAEKTGDRTELRKYRRQMKQREAK